MTTDIFVSNKEDFSNFDPSTHSGSYSEPFIDLSNAITKGLEIVAPNKGGVINVYLFKGFHFLLGNYSIYNPKTKDEHSLNMIINIK